jgi:hypothetical protein
MVCAIGGLVYQVQGSGFRVWAFGFRLRLLGLVWCVGFWVLGSWWSVWGLGLSVVLLGFRV